MSRVKGKGTCTVCKFGSIRIIEERWGSYFALQVLSVGENMQRNDLPHVAMLNKRHWQRREQWFSRPVVRLMPENTLNKIVGLHT